MLQFCFGFVVTQFSEIITDLLSSKPSNIVAKSSNSWLILPDIAKTTFGVSSSNQITWLISSSDKSKNILEFLSSDVFLLSLTISIRTRWPNFFDFNCSLASIGVTFDSILIYRCYPLWILFAFIHNNIMIFFHDCFC